MEIREKWIVQLFFIQYNYCMEKLYFGWNLDKNRSFCPFSSIFFGLSDHFSNSNHDFAFFFPKNHKTRPKPFFGNLMTRCFSKNCMKKWISTTQLPKNVQLSHIIQLCLQLVLTGFQRLYNDCIQLLYTCIVFWFCEVKLYDCMW